MNGIMTPGEIVREYRMSPDTPTERRKELKVLAELNGCSTGEIAQILDEAGETVDARFLRKPKVKEAWQTAEEIGETEAAEDQARVVEDADPYKGDEKTGEDGLPRRCAPRNDRDEAILITPWEAQLICDFIREQLIAVVVDDVSTGTVVNDVEFEWLGQMILLYDRLGKRLDKAANASGKPEAHREEERR